MQALNSDHIKQVITLTLIAVALVPTANLTFFYFEDTKHHLILRREFIIALLPSYEIKFPALGHLIEQVSNVLEKRNPFG